MTNVTAYQRAIQWLSRREYSAFELADRLKQKQFPDGEIAETLTRLKEAKYQCDARFVASRIRTRVSQGKGPCLIVQELKTHQISDELIQHALYEGEICWASLARETRERRFGPNLPEDYPTKAKQMRFLQSRGFDFEQIKLAFLPQDTLS